MKYLTEWKFYVDLHYVWIAILVRKKGKERERMEEKKRFFVQEGREGKGMKIIFPSNLSNFGKIYTLTKYIHLFIPKPFPPNPFPPVLLSKQGVSHPSKSLSFLSLHFFSIKTHS